MVDASLSKTYTARRNKEGLSFLQAVGILWDRAENKQNRCLAFNRSEESNGVSRPIGRDKSRTNQGNRTLACWPKSKNVYAVEGEPNSERVKQRSAPSSKQLGYGCPLFCNPGTLHAFFFRLVSKPSSSFEQTSTPPWVWWCSSFWRAMVNSKRGESNGRSGFSKEAAKNDSLMDSSDMIWNYQTSRSLMSRRGKMFAFGQPFLRWALTNRGAGWRRRT